MDYISSFFRSSAPEEEESTENFSSTSQDNYNDPRLENRLRNFQAIIEYYNSSNYDHIPKSILAQIISHFDQVYPTYREVMTYFKENKLSQYYSYGFRFYRLFNEDIPVLDDEQINLLLAQFEKISWKYYTNDLEKEIGFSYLFHQLCLLNQYRLGNYIEYNIYQAEKKLPQYQETWNQIINSELLQSN